MTGRTRTRGDYVVTKALATVELGEDDSADGPGTFSLILSTDSVDRDGEVVEKGAFNPLPDHISMDMDHGMSVATTVGSGRPFYNASGDLQVDGTFASTELGQTVRTLVREGHVRTASVAMIPTVKTKAKDAVGPVRITKADLLNGAFTPVPSNTRATVLAAKHVDALKAGRRNSASDQESVQTIHDMSAGLGAVCGDGSSEGKSVAVGAAIKSIVGSVEALQDRCRDALEDAYGEYGVCLRGVLPDSVVFDFYGDNDGQSGLESGSTYQQTYTDDGAVVTLTGEPSEIDVYEVVAPDADADREGKSAANAAAQAAADAADDVDAIVKNAALAALKALAT